MRDKRINRYMSMAAVFAVCSAILPYRQTDKANGGGTAKAADLQAPLCRMDPEDTEHEMMSVLPGGQD